MALLILIVGGTLCIGGMIAHLAELRLCRRLRLAMRDRPERLTATEIWLNTRQFRKRRKLGVIVASDSDEALRIMARRALRLGMLVYGLSVPGLIAMLIGAALRASACS